MGSAILSEAILTVAVVVAGALVAQTFVVSLSEMQYSSSLAMRDFGKKINTAVQIIYATNTTPTNVTLWVKNVGFLSFNPQLIRMCDILLLSPERVTHYSYSNSGTGWTYRILNGEDEKWDYGETLEVNLSVSSPLQAGDYTVIFVTYNGVSSEYSFTVG